MITRSAHPEPGGATRVLPRRRSTARAVALAVAGTLVLLAHLAAARPAGAQTDPAGTAPSAPTTVLVPSPSHGEESANATFGIGPASAKGPDGRGSFYYAASPGAVLQDNVAVQNISSAPLTLDFYTADVVVGANSSADLPPKAEAPKDAGTWITLDIPGRPSTITVPARTSVVVPIIVRVPADASPGDHGAGIIVSLSSDARTDKGDLVKVDQRVAVRAQFRVSGTLLPKLEVEDIHASFEQTRNPFGRGDATVTYTVHNTGNVRLAGHQRVEVVGLLRASAAADPVPDLPTLLPGASVSVTAHVPSVWPQFTSTADVHIDPTAVTGDADPQLGLIDASTRFWTLPVALLVLIVLLLIGGALWRRRSRPVAGGGDGTNARVEADRSGDAADPGVHEAPEHEVVRS